MDKVQLTNDVTLVVTGKITFIDDVRELDTGAKSVKFSVKNNEGYDGKEQEYEFDFYCSAARAENVDKFIKFKKVGSIVDVNFKISARRGKNKYADRIFTNLGAWSVFDHKEKEEEEPPNYDDVIDGPAVDTDDVPF